MRQNVHIEAPVEKVFDFFFEAFKDPAKYPDLSLGRATYDDVKVTEGGVGSYGSWHARIYGLPMRGFDVITDVVPNKHITERSSNSMVGRWDFDFEPEGSGTKLTMEHHAESLWSMRPMRDLLDLAVERMNDTFMARLKDTIEAQGSQPAASGAR